MTYLEMYEKIFTAIQFIVRGRGIPKQIIVNAAEEAAKIIYEYIQERKLEASETNQ